MIEKTLVILKPCTVQRALIGEILHRFERKGLRLAGMKMMKLTDEVLSEHYAHLSAKAFLSACERFYDDSSCCHLLLRGGGRNSNCPYVGWSY